MTGRVVVVTSENVISIRELTYSFDELCMLIGSKGLEVVKTTRLVEYFPDATVDNSTILCMLVDDMGSVENLPLNSFASYMYGADKHGLSIYGDVIFVELDQYGQDYPLTFPQYVVSLIEKFFI